MQRLTSSFRDPAGFLYTEDGVLLRRVTEAGLSGYKFLMESGLYQALVREKLLIPHTERPGPVLEPEIIPFISYPYEWGFEQLRDAALATLQVQILSLEYGMGLKDASAYNVQFRRGRPVLIDTLSFVGYQPGEPWVAYRQFCQHFVAPLLLMTYRDVRISQLLRAHLAGLPLDLAVRLLPGRAWLGLLATLHVRLHARVLAHASASGRKPLPWVSRGRLLGILAHLESGIERLRPKYPKGGWAGYANGPPSYTAAELAQKQAVIRDYITVVRPRTVWDLGANTGEYSGLAHSLGASVVAIDSDYEAIDQLYRRYRSRAILPLVMDLTNPSPGVGWEGAERTSLAGRGPADMVLALALVHHLAIGNNLPLGRIASWLSKLCRYLAIEWVPKEDLMVQKMLSTRQDVFPGYTQAAFEQAFDERFHVLKTAELGSGRVIYLAERRVEVGHE